MTRSRAVIALTKRRDCAYYDSNSHQGNRQVYCMNLSRYFKENTIKLEMETVVEPFNKDKSREKWIVDVKTQVLEELVTLLEQDARIGNRTKLMLDFVNREKKATTAIGNGIAIPHIRSLQAKEFMIAFARSTEGYEFDSLDSKPSHMFFVMAAPPYEDQLYLRVFKALAEALQYESFREELMIIQSPGELIRAFRSLSRSPNRQPFARSEHQFSVITSKKNEHSSWIFVL